MLALPWGIWSLMKLKIASRLPSSQFARNLSPTSVGPRSDPVRSELWQREQLRSKVALPRSACPAVYTPSQMVTVVPLSCASRREAVIEVASATNAKQVRSVLGTWGLPALSNERAGSVSHCPILRRKTERQPHGAAAADPGATSEQRQPLKTRNASPS